VSDALCRFIEAAFSEASRPAYGTLSIPTYDDEDTNAHFGRTDWRDHDVTGLREHDSSLGFFTPPAFRYYLPAFLIASIRDPDGADVIPERIISELERAISSDAERLRAFTSREREALSVFVEWWRDFIYPSSSVQPLERRQRAELTALADALRASDRNA